MSEYIIKISEGSQKGKILLDLLNLLGVSYELNEPNKKTLGKALTLEEKRFARKLKQGLKEAQQMQDC